ncbi:hypothetical protein [Rubritalea tangerina]|uniref:hypothetical protein n=1 Tax=Rubritalea tangerina TaxID=430798 RepID=UPI00360B7F87
MTGCQSLHPRSSYQWSDETARASANLQPEFLRAERKFSEEKGGKNWSTKLAEASRVGVTATSDGGSGSGVFGGFAEVDQGRRNHGGGSGEIEPAQAAA